MSGRMENGNPPRSVVKGDVMMSKGPWMSQVRVSGFLLLLVMLLTMSFVCGVVLLFLLIMFL